MTAPVTELLETVLTGGVRAPHFFNGRVLTGEALEALKVAVWERQNRLGRAIGDGVVTGLEVELNEAASTLNPARPLVRVGRGLAINRRGEPLQLPADLELALVAEPPGRTFADGLFDECLPPTATLTNLGLYILTIQPGGGFEGRVPMTTVGAEGIAPACGSSFAVTGVRFRMARLAIATDPDAQSLSSRVLRLAAELEVLIGQLPATNPPPLQAAEAFRKTSLLRNGVAHLCFGTVHPPFATDPFARTAKDDSAFLRRGLIDEMRTAGLLTDCEVPLAMVYWTSLGVSFVDQWAVRRAATPPPFSLDWPVPASERVIRDGIATVLQFQGQVESILRTPALPGSLATLDAQHYFWLLPPAGVIPLADPGIRGLDSDVFLSSRPHRTGQFLEGARLPHLIREASGYPPIDLREAEMVWVYQTRENALRPAGVPRSAVFVTGQVPEPELARFDVSRWDYSNFAACCAE
jgi:hypothetical protein